MTEPAPRLGKYTIGDVLGRGAATAYRAYDTTLGRDVALKVLPAGTPVRSPVDLLSSNRAKELFEELRRRFSQVIVDTAPVVPFTDADVLGAYGDGVLLVARACYTQQSLFARAIGSITSTTIVGTVLNDVTYSFADRGTYDHDYYHEYYDKKRKR